MWRLAPRTLGETKHSAVGRTPLQVTSPESRGAIAVCSSLSLLIEGVVVNWLRHDGLGSQASEWLALAIVILLALVPGVALLKLVISRLARARDKDKSERDYWHIHGG